MTGDNFGDVGVTLDDEFVATVEIHRPPENYFDVALIRSLAEAYEALDADGGCRAIVLCSEGKHFCAGADFRRPAGGAGGGAEASPRGRASCTARPCACSRPACRWWPPSRGRPSAAAWAWPARPTSG